MSENAANKGAMTRPHADMALTTSGAMMPHSLEQAIEVAKMIAHSGMVPKVYAGNVGAVLIAFQMGAEVGLPPMAAIQNIAVINGRPSLWGDAMLGVCMAHPSFVDVVEDDLDTIRKAGKATCIATRKGLEPRTGTFTVDMAKEAGLWKKAGPWTQYWPRMMQMRARGFALRDTWPDVLRGLYMAEEARDIPKPVEGDIIATTQLSEGTHDLRRKPAETEAPATEPEPETEPPEPMTAKAKMAAIREAETFDGLTQLLEGEDRASVLKVADVRRKQLDKMLNDGPPGAPSTRPAPDGPPDNDGNAGSDKVRDASAEWHEDGSAEPAEQVYCVCGPDVQRLPNAKACHSCGQPYNPDPVDPEDMPLWGMGANEE